MLEYIYFNILQYLKQTVQTELFWIVLPLAIATIVMLVYSQKYKDEKSSWESHTSNSLVLLFIAVASLRHIYDINNEGLINFVNYSLKSSIVILLLVVGIILFFLNFERYLPEKIAVRITSPLTVNLIAYMMLLFVYSNSENVLSTFISLIVFFLALYLVLNFLKLLVKKLFGTLRKMKEKEKIDEIVNEKKNFTEKKRQLKQEENILKRGKKAIQKEEEKTKGQRIKKLDKQKKEAVKLKKVARGKK